LKSSQNRPFRGQFIARTLAADDLPLLNSRPAVASVRLSTPRTIRAWSPVSSGRRAWLTVLPRSRVPVVRMARYVGASLLFYQHSHRRTRSTICTSSHERIQQSEVTQ